MSARQGAGLADSCRAQALREYSRRIPRTGSAGRRSGPDYRSPATRYPEKSEFVRRFLRPRSLRQPPALVGSPASMQLTLGAPNQGDTT